VVAALVGVAAVAVRGSLPPGDGPAIRPHELSRATSSYLLAMLLGVAMVILAFATVERIRGPKSPGPGPGNRLEWIRRDRVRAGRRFWFVVAALSVASLLLVEFLVRLHIGRPDDEPPFEWAPQTDVADPSARPPAPPRPLQPEDPTAMRIVLVASAVFLLLAAVAAIGGRRPRPPDAEPAAWEPDRPAEAEEASLARAAALGLAEAGNPDRDPRAAIIACYAAMEHELARVPAAAPREFDTASDVLARAVRGDALTPDAATSLVELFKEARFSRHAMDEGHREIAVHSLRLVLAELRGTR
jgi:Domain of unknown function (DUF4129)